MLGLLFIEEVKSEAKSIVNTEETNNLFNHVKELVKQGKFLELMQPGKAIFSTCPGAL